MALRRSITGSIRARSPFSLKSTNSKKQWQRESDAIGRNLLEQGWSSEDISSIGHTLVDPSLADFAIIHIPPVSPPTKEIHIKESEAVHDHDHDVVGGEDEDDGPKSDSGVEVGRVPPPARPAPQKIKPSFILSPRPFIPGLPHASGPPARRSLSFHREPTPTASLSRKGSTRSQNRRSRTWNGKGKEREKRMTVRRMDSRRSRLTWPTRALSSLRRKRISEAAAEGESMRLGFDSAILLTGLEDEVDEFGRKTNDHRGKLPEDIPLPPSPGASNLSLPLDDDEAEPRHQLPHDAESSSASLTSASSSSSDSHSGSGSDSFVRVERTINRYTTTHTTNNNTGTYPYKRSRRTTILKNGKKFNPYYTRPLPIQPHSQLHWEFDPVASTYLFINTVIVFAEPVLPDLNFLGGAKVPGVSEWRGRHNEEAIGQAI